MKQFDIVLVKGCGRKVFKVHYYNNNLTNTQTATFTSFQRAATFIQLLEEEGSVPMVYLEVIETK